MCIILRIAYERSPVSPTMSTFLLSALWHGFYPGYYIMFVFFALCAIVGRKVVIIIVGVINCSIALF